MRKACESHQSTPALQQEICLSELLLGLLRGYRRGGGGNNLALFKTLDILIWYPFYTTSYWKVNDVSHGN